MTDEILLDWASPIEDLFSNANAQNFSYSIKSRFDDVFYLIKHVKIRISVDFSFILDKSLVVRCHD